VPQIQALAKTLKPYQGLKLKELLVGAKTLNLQKP